MNGSFRIARIAGAEVRIHYTFLLLVAFLAYLGYKEAGSPGALDSILFGLSIFMCVLLHEFGHALAGRACGIRTPDITLLPVGGVARLEKIPSSSVQELFITAAGPAVNVAIAAALMPFSHSVPSFHQLLGILAGGGLPADYFTALLWVNLNLIVFNLIPAFPMDGGRIFRALLAFRLPYPLATRIASGLGQGIAVLFIIAGFIPWPQGQQFMLLFIGLFIFIAARQEFAYASFRSSLEQHSLAEVMTTDFETLSGSLRLGDAPDLLLASNQQVFPVLDDTGHFLGLAVRDDLMASARSQPPETSLAEVARAVPVVPVESSLTDILEMMQAQNEPILPVTNLSGRVIGLVEFAKMAQVSARGKRL